MTAACEGGRTEQLQSRGSHVRGVRYGKHEEKVRGELAAAGDLPAAGYTTANPLLTAGARIDS